MKSKFFLVLCLLLLIIKCEEDEGEDLGDLCENAEETSVSGCSKIFNETVQKEYRCCYADYKVKGKNEEKGCVPVTKAQAEDLDKLKEELKEEEEYEKLEIDCDSAFLKIGLFSLLAALLI